MVKQIVSIPAKGSRCATSMRGNVFALVAACLVVALSSCSKSGPTEPPPRATRPTGPIAPTKALLDLAKDPKSSGVWGLKNDVRMTLIKTFSWGKNPYSEDSIIIDLGAKLPTIYWNGDTFWPSDVKIANNIYVYTGWWIGGLFGSITIHYLDADTMWVGQLDPPTASLAWEGDSNIYVRIPPDAPVVPIDPETGP